jgi:hypothetical protein
MHCSKTTCHDHLVGGDEERGRHGEIERLGGGWIDYQIEFGWLFYRNIGGVRPAQNLVDEVCPRAILSSTF